MSDDEPKASVTFTEHQVAAILLKHLLATGRAPAGAPAYVQTTWDGVSRSVTVTWPVTNPNELKPKPPKRSLRLVKK